MSKTINLAVAVFVAMMAIGCTQPTDPEPDPVKIPTTNIAYMAIIGTDDIALDTMYRWDENADGIADTGLFVEIGGTEYTVSLDDPDWVITVGGSQKYLNATIMGDWNWSSGSSGSAGYSIGFTRSGNDILVKVYDGDGNFINWTYSYTGVGADEAWNTFTYDGINTITMPDFPSDTLWTR